MAKDTDQKNTLKTWERFMRMQLYRLPQQQLQQSVLRTNLQLGSSNSANFGILAYHYFSHQFSLSSSRDSRGSYRKYDSSNQFELDLAVADGNQATPRSFLNDAEFRQKYRMSRGSLSKLTDLLKNHKAFQSPQQWRPQLDPKYQLMTLLVYLGTEGSGASNLSLRSIFHLGSGSFENFKKRSVSAIIDCLGNQYCNWPIAGERREIAKRFRNKFGWPNCCGTIDGTLLPLSFPPETADAPDYHGRKYRYSLSVLVVNDDKKRIRYFLAGWPGKTHDNRVLRNSRLGTDPSQFFCHNEYILGDSAFETQWYCIPAFKKPAGLPIPEHHSRFNDLLKSPRVLSEHTIGMWKGRFPWLRAIRMRITEDKKTLREILRMIKVTVILHNFLVEENDFFEDSWYNMDDMFDDDEEGGDATDELNQCASSDANLRREQLVNYFSERNMI